MNTPDTEWETEFDENYNQVTLWNGLGYGNVHTKLKSFIIRTCVAEWNKGFEKGRSEYLDKAKDIDELLLSRDTHWKERVRKNVGVYANQQFMEGTVVDPLELYNTIIGEDNLK